MPETPAGHPPEQDAGDATTNVDAQSRPYYTYPGRQSAPDNAAGNASSRRGCLLPVIISMVVVLALVGIVIFVTPLDPMSLLTGSRQYTQLTEDNNAVAVMRAVEGRDTSGSPGIISEPAFTVSVAPESPGESFAVSLGVVSSDDFAAGRGRESWVSTASDSLNPSLSLESQFFSISTQGTPPEMVVLTVNLETPSESPELLDLYGYDAASGAWHFIPSQINSDNDSVTACVEDLPDGVALFRASEPDPVVATTLGFNHTLTRDAAQLSSIVTPLGMQPSTAAGEGQTLQGSLAPGFEIGSSYDVMPRVRNYTDPNQPDVQTVSTLLTDGNQRATHVENLTAFVAAGNYDGLFIDYRGLPDDQREAFTTFVEQLSDSLHEINAELGVAVPAAQNVDGTWQTGAYDWRALGAAVDYLEIDLPLDPTAYTPEANRYVEAMLRWAVGEVNRYKIIGSMAARSIRQEDEAFRPVSYEAALDALGEVQISTDGGSDGAISPGSEIRLRLDGQEALPGIDESIQAPFIDYFNPDESLDFRMWLTTRRALRFRLERLAPFGIGGAAFSDLLSPGVADGVLQGILDYTLQVPPPEPSDETLRLQWQVEAPDGSVVQDVTTGFNEEAVLTLDAPEADYTVNVDVAGNEVISQRDSQQVALYAPTATPTPLPTTTPTPVPSATPTLRPVVPTGTAVPGATPLAAINPPPAPGSGSINMDTFEYGGHVTSTNSQEAINAMRNAGMTWMKVQIRYGPGANTDQAFRAIQDAKQNGFKILLGIVGNPGDVSSGGEGYIQGYANFVGSVAAQGPDAIEVWNEPNLGREWPAGQISGANYTALLRASYQEIKARNPNVMVISAAPAPTGAEQAYPGQVVNDDRFLTQMVNAGAMQFTDCVGVHYNEGVVSGSATSGDPRDDYYTRYLPTLIDRYWRITQGQRPLCITELGYLSPEGFGSLPLNFAWAQNVSVAQQASYLADAASFASRSGKVRLMIVWNVDFDRYDEDPMAGYAIIRPDGSCPACGALAGAR